MADAIVVELRFLRPAFDAIRDTPNFDPPVGPIYKEDEYCCRFERVAIRNIYFR